MKKLAYATLATWLATIPMAAMAESSGDAEKTQFRAHSSACFTQAKQQAATAVSPEFKTIYEGCMAAKGYHLAGSGEGAPSASARKKTGVKAP